jgi:hypothetical protein
MVLLIVTALDAGVPLPSLLRACVAEDDLFDRTNDDPASEDSTQDGMPVSACSLSRVIRRAASDVHALEPQSACCARRADAAAARRNADRLAACGEIVELIGCGARLLC